MKIGISSTGQTISSPVDPRFGRCSYFAIYNTDDKLVSVTTNNAQHAGGGAGIAAAQQMIDEDVEIILTGNMWPQCITMSSEQWTKNIPNRRCLGRESHTAL